MAAKTATEDKRAEAVKMAMAQIEKSHGKGSLMKLGDQVRVEIPGISTGALSFDLALGGRGIPRGRVVDIYGPASYRKTTIALQTIADRKSTRLQSSHVRQSRMLSSE